MSPNWKWKVTRNGYSCIRKADFKTKIIKTGQRSPRNVEGIHWMRRSSSWECTRGRGINLVRSRRSEQL